MSPTNDTQFHVLTNTSEYAQLLTRRVREREIIELGVGTGVLTRLLLDAGAKHVLGWEILPDVCGVKESPRFTLFPLDYTKMEDDFQRRHGKCLVANPAYDTLPFIVEKVLPHTPDAILMIPERALPEFEALGFLIAFKLTGDDFEPKATGTHIVIIRGFEENADQFVDLTHEVGKLRSSTIPERIEELSKRLPSVGLCAVGGFPITNPDGQGARWCGKFVISQTFRDHFLDALGLSAVLTYTNKKGHSLEALGRICADRNETWAYHWVTVTLVFSRFSPAVHLAFARDTRFKLGWAVEKEYTGKLFGVWTASGTVSDWLKYTAKWNDMSFDAQTREAMSEAYDLIRGILP